jgi:hypothetical protein
MSRPGLPARRGDIAVIESTRHDYVQGKGSTVRYDVEITLVTSVTKTGFVKEVRDAWGSLRKVTPNRLDTLVRVLPASQVDPGDAMKVAKDHHWPGHPDQPRPFGSLEEVRQALTPHRKDVVQLDPEASQ